MIAVVKPAWRPLALLLLSLRVAVATEGEEPATGLSGAEENAASIEAGPQRVRNTFFEVFADDTLSAQFVATMGEMFGQRFNRLLTAPSRGTQPVLVNLLPAKGEDIRPAVANRYFPAGYVVVDLRWDADTTREVVERALAQGHLTSLSAAYGQGKVHVPFWLEVAGQHLARVQAVPAHAQTLAAKARGARPMRLEEILTAERGASADAVLEANAYWLLMFLEREGRGRGEMKNFLVRLLRGEAPVQALGATYGGRVRSREEARLWWLVGWDEITRPTGAPVLAAEESRRRLTQLESFTFFKDGATKRIFASDLWPHRTDPVVRVEVSRRLQVIQMEVGVTHPFYQNALLSFGRLLEAVLSESYEDFQEALVARDSDMREGDELAEDTGAILADLAAELAE